MPAFPALNFIFFLTILFLFLGHFRFWFWVLSFAFHIGVLQGFPPPHVRKCCGEQISGSQWDKSSSMRLWHRLRSLSSLFLLHAVFGKGTPTSVWGTMREICPSGGGAGSTLWGKFAEEAALSLPGRLAGRAGGLLTTCPPYLWLSSSTWEGG